MNSFFSPPCESLSAAANWCVFVQWVEAMQKFQEAAELVDAENRMKKTMWGQFWSSHQRFFKYLCIAAKVNHAVVTAR